MQPVIVSISLIFQIFLKVAEESGVDAETSGNPPGGLHTGLCLLQAAQLTGAKPFPLHCCMTFLSFVYKFITDAESLFCKK